MDGNARQADRRWHRPRGICDARWRAVSWNDKKCEVANLRANNYGGQNDASLLKFFDDDVLKLGGVNMVFESQPLVFAQQDERDQLPEMERQEGVAQPVQPQLQGDQVGRVEQAYETYLANTIRQVVLYFEGDKYEAFIDKITKFKSQHGMADNTEAVEKLLEMYGDEN